MEFRLKGMFGGPEEILTQSGVFDSSGITVLGLGLTKSRLPIDTDALWARGPVEADCSRSACLAGFSGVTEATVVGLRTTSYRVYFDLAQSASSGVQRL